MIEFRHVCKRYPPGIDALADIDFTIGAGELAVIGGHSGAGKSTLLKLIAAIERPTGGVVLVGGQNGGVDNAGDLARRIGRRQPWSKPILVG